MDVPTVYYPSKKEEWGPSLWNYFHNFTTKYPDNPKRHDKLAAKDTIRRFIDAIPCVECEQDFRQYVSTNPPNFDNKTSLFNWGVNAHNYVNKKLGKPVHYAAIGKQPESIKQVIVKEPKQTISLGMDFKKLAIFGLEDFNKAFPMYNSLDDAISYDVNPPMQNVQDPTIAAAIPTTQSEIQTMQDDLDNSFAQFNSIYQFPSEAVGLKPAEVNIIYTPQILAAISQLVVETNMTNFGAMLVSLLASIGIITSSVLMKPTLSHGDKLLLQNVSANYIANTLKYTNPKSLHNIMEDGSRLIDLIMNWGKKDKDAMKELFEIFVLTPTMLKEKDKKMSDEEMMKGLAKIAGKSFTTDEEGNPVSIDSDLDIDPRAFEAISDIRSKQMGSAKSADSKYPLGSILGGGSSSRVNMFSTPRPTASVFNTIPSPLSYEQDFGFDEPLDDYPLY